MSTKKRKKRRRLKSGVIRFFIYFTFFFIMGIYSIVQAFKISAEFRYRETYEYKITEIGYPIEEAKKLISILPDNKLEELLTKEYNEAYYKIVTQKYFLTKNYDKYVQYKELHEDESYENIIAIVNVHASSGWYNESFNTNTNDGYAMLVNKFYHLEESYERTDLENISLEYSYANQKAATIVIENFKKMRDDILTEKGIHLMINSSYRPYKDQEEIYNEYKKVSLQYADSYAARPGYSEHQTGLAIDITSLEHPYADDFKESDEYTWLKENCYKYGFILRYPENKENITGYSTESWHFRYVGNDISKKIHDENITFDEYYAYYIEK